VGPRADLKSVEKIIFLTLAGSRTPTVQPVDHR
jgi:hypothetical protein